MFVFVLGSIHVSDASENTLKGGKCLFFNISWTGCVCGCLGSFHLCLCCVCSYLVSFSGCLITSGSFSLLVFLCVYISMEMTLSAVTHFHYANTRNPALCLGCELISDGKLLHVYSSKKLQISAQMLKSPFRWTVCFVETQINRHPSKGRTQLKPKHLQPSHSSLRALPLNNNTAEKQR